MAVVESVPARLAHVHLIAPRMRAADKAEVWASDRLRPAAVLRRSLRRADFARTVFIDGAPAAMFGVWTIVGVGVPWVLTTDVVDRFPLSFWRASKHVMRELSRRYPVLVQCIDARHEQGLRWARHLGFIIAAPHPCGPEGLPFHQARFTVKAD